MGAFLDQAVRSEFRRNFGPLPATVEAAISEAIASPRPLLIEGESGTGKTFLARAIHRYGPRAARPCIAVNCASFSEALFEAEFFGHRRGAFTGATTERKGLIEAAHGGTLILDEIADLMPTHQAKLLTVLDDGTFRRVGSNELTRADFRLISVTNRSLVDRVANREFRADLFHRCSSLYLRLPPLRERPADLREIILHVLSSLPAQDRRNNGRTSVPGIGPEAMQLLCGHSWPGNIRDVITVLEVARGRCGRREIQAHHLRDTLGRLDSVAEAIGARPPEKRKRRKRYVPPANRAVERRQILDALSRSHNNKSQAARELGLSRSTLYERMLRLGLYHGIDDHRPSRPWPIAGLRD